MARATDLFVSASKAKASTSSSSSSSPSPTSSSCPVTGDMRSSKGGGCPVDEKTKFSANVMPKISNEATATGGGASSSGASALSSHRQVSSIPIGKTELPNHQEESASRWTYPSPRMFYNAMRRKGWQPKEEDMDVVVAIHNTVNERVWHHILK